MIGSQAVVEITKIPVIKLLETYNGRKETKEDTRISFYDFLWYFTLIKSCYQIPLLPHTHCPKTHFNISEGEKGWNWNWKKGGDGRERKKIIYGRRIRDRKTTCRMISSDSLQMWLTWNNTWTMVYSNQQKEDPISRKHSPFWRGLVTCKIWSIQNNERNQKNSYSDRVKGEQVNGSSNRSLTYNIKQVFNSEFSNRIIGIPDDILPRPCNERLKIIRWAGMWIMSLKLGMGGGAERKCF